MRPVAARVLLVLLALAGCEGSSPTSPRFPHSGGSRVVVTALGTSVTHRDDNFCSAAFFSREVGNEVFLSDRARPSCGGTQVFLHFPHARTGTWSFPDLQARSARVRGFLTVGDDHVSYDSYDDPRATGRLRIDRNDSRPGGEVRGDVDVTLSGRIFRNGFPARVEVTVRGDLRMSYLRENPIIVR